MPTANKFDKIMSSSNKTEILNLSKYSYFANKLRKDLEKLKYVLPKHFYQKASLIYL